MQCSDNQNADSDACTTEEKGEKAMTDSERILQFAELVYKLPQLKTWKDWEAIATDSNWDKSVIFAVLAVEADDFLWAPEDCRALGYKMLDDCCMIIMWHDEQSATLHRVSPPYGPVFMRSFVARFPKSNPLHFNLEDNQWYFWDETWADRHGPFPTAKAANAALEKYCKEVLG